MDLFEHSQYFADQLVRHPELLREVERACGARQGRTGFVAPRDPAELRRFFRQQMVRIQSDSVYHRVPVFKTLKRTSELAESVIAAAYEIALDGGARRGSAREPPVHACESDDGDRARAARHAGVRSGFGRRSGFCDPRRGCVPKCSSGRA